jgi:uncharacterized protein (TIGR02996 family)
VRGGSGQVGVLILGRTVRVASMNVLDRLLQAIVADPLAEDCWLVLADWLDEHEDPRRAELLRLHRRLLATCCEPEEHPERLEQQARPVGLLADGVRPCVPQKRVVLSGGVEMTFSFIPDGQPARRGRATGSRRGPAPGHANEWLLDGQPPGDGSPVGDRATPPRAPPATPAPS